MVAFRPEVAAVVASRWAKVVASVLRPKKARNSPSDRERFRV